MRGRGGSKSGAQPATKKPKSDAEADDDSASIIALAANSQRIISQLAAITSAVTRYVLLQHTIIACSGIRGGTASAVSQATSTTLHPSPAGPGLRPFEQVCHRAELRCTRRVCLHLLCAFKALSITTASTAVAFVGSVCYFPRFCRKCLISSEYPFVRLSFHRNCGVFTQIFPVFYGNFLKPFFVS